MKRIAIFVVAIVAIGMVATGAAVADNTVLQGDDEDTVEDFNASDEEYITFTLDADDTDFGTDGTEEVLFNVTYDDVEHFADDEVVDDADADYEVNISHDGLETVPGDAGSGVTIEMNVWGEDDDGNVTTNLESFDVSLEFHDEYAVIYVEEADDIEDEEVWYWFDSFNAETREDVGIVDEDTVVHIHSVDDDLNDAVDLATEDTDEGDRVALMMASTLDGDLLYVYDGEPGETIAGDDIENEDLSYLVVEDDDYATLHFGDDYEAHEDEITVDVLANQRPEASDLRADLDYDFFQSLAGAWGLSIPLLSAAGLLVLSRRR